MAQLSESNFGKNSWELEQVSGVAGAGRSCLVPVALACFSELEHNLYRNCRLALSIMFQPSWALRKERLLSYWSRQRAWHAACWKQAHLC